MKKKVIRITEAQLDSYIKASISEQFSGFPPTKRTSNLQSPDEMEPDQKSTTAPVKPAESKYHDNASMMRTEFGSGDSGSKVKEIQNNLIALGYGIGKMGADGKFGPNTARAITMFQGSQKLPATGRADKETMNRLAAAVKTKKLTNPLQNPPQTNTTAPVTPAAPKKNMGYGGGGGWLSRKLANSNMNEARDILMDKFKKLF